LPHEEKFQRSGEELGASGKKEDSYTWLLKKREFSKSMIL
jgi:hypothetical protein